MWRLFGMDGASESWVGSDGGGEGGGGDGW